MVLFHFPFYFLLFLNDGVSDDDGSKGQKGTSINTWEIRRQLGPLRRCRSTAAKFRGGQNCDATRISGILGVPSDSLIVWIQMYRHTHRNCGGDPASTYPRVRNKQSPTRALSTVDACLCVSCQVQRRVFDTLYMVT